jgi:hypothetical protein
MNVFNSEWKNWLQGTFLPIFIAVICLNFDTFRTLPRFCSDFIAQNVVLHG